MILWAFECVSEVGAASLRSRVDDERFPNCFIVDPLAVNLRRCVDPPREHRVPTRTPG